VRPMSELYTLYADISIDQNTRADTQ
jgi:hypothetical protein